MHRHISVSAAIDFQSLSAIKTQQIGDICKTTGLYATATTNPNSNTNHINHYYCASDSALLTIVRIYKLYLLTYLLT